MRTLRPKLAKDGHTSVVVWGLLFFASQQLAMAALPPPPPLQDQPPLEDQYAPDTFVFRSELISGTLFPPYLLYHGDFQRVDLSLLPGLEIQPSSVFIKASLWYFDKKTFIRDLTEEEFPNDPSLDCDGRVSPTLRVNELSHNFAGVPFVVKFECLDPPFGIAPCFSNPFYVKTQMEHQKLVMTRPIELPPFNQIAPSSFESTGPYNFSHLYARPTSSTNLDRLCRDTNLRVRILQRRL
jgi:hypothetical protein